MPPCWRCAKRTPGRVRPFVPQGDKQLARLFSRFETAAQDYLDEHREGAVHDEVLQLYFDVHFYLRIWGCMTSTSPL